MTETEKFFSILRIAIGKPSNCNFSISAREWQMLYETAFKHGLIGVVFSGVEKLIEAKPELKPPLPLLYEWIGQCEIIKRQNELLNQQCKKLNFFFRTSGISSCILKGQGVSFLYKRPELRQAGDIDIWVDAERDDVVSYLKKSGVMVTDVDYVNCHAHFFEDTEVEVHFKPTYMHNLFVNRKLQKWINLNKKKQMENFDYDEGFSYPYLDFNLVFSLIHVYRHVFGDGIGLRQITDYYFIIINATESDRKNAFETLRFLGLTKFAASIMYILGYVFDLSESKMLCVPNKQEGVFLLSEIMRGGNFGKFDDRNVCLPNAKRIIRGLNNLKHNSRYIAYYPGEVLWTPIWKVWHWGWRKKHGYL